MENGKEVGAERQHQVIGVGKVVGGKKERVFLVDTDANERNAPAVSTPSTSRVASFVQRNALVLTDQDESLGFLEVSIAASSSKLAKSEMRRSFGNERDYAHEKPSAVFHPKTTQKFQGWDNDRDRPWGHLEPLLHAQRGRRGR